MTESEPVRATPPTVRPCWVAQRIYRFEPVRAWRTADGVVFSDQRYYRHDGPRRTFWLPDEGVQFVYEPFGWTGEWYVDLVEVGWAEHDGADLLTVKDAYLDLVVEGMGPTYRLLDLDELLTAVLEGELPADLAVSYADRMQRFLDAHLHRAVDFPPRSIDGLFDRARPHEYPDWREPPADSVEGSGQPIDAIKRPRRRPGG